MLDIQDNHDGYHTFRELYECRHALYIALVKQNREKFKQSLFNSNGEKYDGWFLLQGDLGTGQISFHLPDKYWPIDDLAIIPEPMNWDGHTTKDVIERLLAIK